MMDVESKLQTTLIRRMLVMDSITRLTSESKGEDGFEDMLREEGGRRGR